MEVADSFKVPRGTVQALQASAGRFAAMVSGFCERLGWKDVEGLVSKFQSRVSFGVRSEVVELTEIPFVKVCENSSVHDPHLSIGCQAFPFPAPYSCFLPRREYLTILC